MFYWIQLIFIKYNRM